MQSVIILRSIAMQAAVTCCLATTTIAQIGPVVLDAQADPYRGGSGAVGAGVEPPAVALANGCVRVVRVASVTGSATACPPPCVFHGPDGRSGVFCDPDPWETDIDSASGVSGIRHATRTLFIAGVFLADDDPVPGSEPARLDFSDPTDFARIEPELAQLFFIGNGRNISTGAVQEFVAPRGASRLVLGFADGSCFQGMPTAYNDNAGSFELELEIEVIYARADVDRDGDLTIFDFIEFQTLYVDRDPRADFDGNGIFNLFDFLAFQIEFDRGCD